MTLLAPRFINEYAQFFNDEILLKRKAPGDTPGHLVEAKSLLSFYIILPDIFQADHGALLHANHSC